MDFKWSKSWDEVSNGRYWEQNNETGKNLDVNGKYGKKNVLSTTGTPYNFIPCEFKTSEAFTMHSIRYFKSESW